MHYERTFILTSCHFNDDTVYEIYQKAHDWVKADPSASSHFELFRSLNTCLEQSHGHNFAVTVKARGVPTEDGFLVPDKELEDLVRDWDRINLSVHPDFFDTGLRATTENMAMLLYEKCELVFGFDGNVVFEIVVAETPDQKATYP